ncbi:hypothetical protein [Streptomyces sp. NPDC057623]|uniref:hypothetical protein n=1 Tax=Streptomyces sp. NPDC057623 TaxID=3346187 RepID=UPI0036C47076
MSSAVRVLCLSLLLLLAVPPAATAAERWSLAPLGGGRPSFYGEGPAGTLLEDSVSETNRSGTPVTVRLRATGVRFADGTVRVPARTRADVPFTVTVPAADRTVEIVARDTDGDERRVRVQLRVTVPELSALTVEQVRVSGGRIEYELVNRGTTPLTPKLAVHADGVLGRVLDRAPRTLTVDLPPGSRTKLDEPWPDRPALDAVEVRLTVTAAGGASDTAVAAARFVPWDAVTGSAGALAAVGAFFVVRHRRCRGPCGGETAGAAQPPYEQAELTGART